MGWNRLDGLVWFGVFNFEVWCRMKYGAEPVCQGIVIPKHSGIHINAKQGLNFAGVHRSTCHVSIIGCRHSDLLDV